MNSSTWETLARRIVGALLWLLSAALSASLFLSFGLGDPWRMTVLVLLALALEGAKVLCWRLGGSARPLAMVLIMLSIFASVGSSLQTMALLEDQRQPQLVELELRDRHLQELDLQIQGLQNRIEQLPQSWVTWYRTLTADLAQLRQERKELASTQVIASPHIYTRSGIFEELAKYTQIPQGVLELVILLVMALSLEWAAMALSTSSSAKPLQENSKGRLPKPKPVAPPVSQDEYLFKMVELGEGPFLGGRDRVGKALGLTSYQSRKIFDRLVKAGTIHKVGDRMVRTDEPSGSRPL